MSEALRVDLNGTQIRRMYETFAAIGKDVDPAIARAVNRAGDMARTAVIRALVVQTALPRKTIVAFLRVQKASAAKETSSYVPRGRGGDISLKYSAPGRRHRASAPRRSASDRSSPARS